MVFLHRQMNRRQWLAAAAGSIALPMLRTQSFAAPLDIGGADVTIVSDGHLTLPLGFVLPDVAEADIKALFDANGMAMEPLQPPCNLTLLRKADWLAIFDAGAGANFMPTAGKLMESLAAANVDPAAVTDVVFTHAHPDHLWGILDDLDEVVFPNASFHIGASEWNYWRDPATVDKMPDERKSFAVGAQTRLAAIADKIKQFNAGDEVLPGVEAVDTAGHTPGHMSFMIHGSTDKLFVTGDAISHAVISMQRPDWPSGSDQDPAMGIATRKKLLDRLASETPRIVGFHLPAPGIGRVERKDAAYRFVAEG